MSAGRSWKTTCFHQNFEYQPVTCATVYVRREKLNVYFNEGNPQVKIVETPENRAKGLFFSLIIVVEKMYMEIPLQQKQFITTSLCSLCKNEHASMLKHDISMFTVLDCPLVTGCSQGISSTPFYSFSFRVVASIVYVFNQVID